jgi:hypothetical protein
MSAQRHAAVLKTASRRAEARRLHAVRARFEEEERTRATRLVTEARAFKAYSDLCMADDMAADARKTAEQMAAETDEVLRRRLWEAFKTAFGRAGDS